MLLMHRSVVEIFRVMAGLGEERVRSGRTRGLVKKQKVPKPMGKDRGVGTGMPKMGHS